jgi:virulence-associated protein VagC
LGGPWPPLDDLLNKRRAVLEAHRSDGKPDPFRRATNAALTPAKLSLDQQVDIREEGGRVIIEPILEPAFNLADLPAAVTDENTWRRARRPGEEL